MNSPPRSRAVSLLCSQSAGNGRDPCCSLWGVWRCSCLHSSPLQGEACSSLQRAFVAELFSASAGWWGTSSFPPGNTGQLWLRRDQGRESTRERCSEQLLCKAKEPWCPFPFVHALHCAHAVPPAWSRQGSSQDLGTPCRTTHGTVCCRVEPCHRQGLGSATNICIYTVLGSRYLVPVAAGDEKQPFPLPNFSSPPRGPALLVSMVIPRQQR